MVDLTELGDGHAAAQRRVQVDGALVRGETEVPDPDVLRALVRGLQQLDVDAPPQRQARAVT